MISKILYFTLKRVIYVGFVGYVIPLFLGYIADELLGIQKFYINFALGIIMVVFASILVLSGNYYLIKRGKGTPNPELPPKQVVKNGVYSFMRHPIYFGWILALFAASVFYGSFSLLIISVVMVPLIHIYAVREEKKLLKRFGKSYINYKKEVPMWIPRFRQK